MPRTPLSDQRRRVEHAWRQRFAERGGPVADGPGDAVLASWDRSEALTPVDLAAAPVDESADAVDLWRVSPLRPAIEAVEDELKELAEDRGFVAAVMDDAGRLVWTAGGRHMRRRAETINFAPGGRWDEASVGTNALALSLDTGRPAAVFSAEHYAEMVHGWCCFAAPLRDPETGRSFGVLALSSTWERAHPMALAAVRALALAAQAVLDAEARTLVPVPRAAPAWDVRLLGGTDLRRGGVVLPFAQRQAEVLALLALHPEGLSPEQLHDRLHGEAQVSLVTTKADVSHLRALLDGGIARRRYRLDADITVDVVQLLQAVRVGDARRAADAYAGPLLPSSDAPGVREWRDVVDVAVRDLVLRSGDLEALLALGEKLPYDVEVQAVAVATVPSHDPRSGWARARLRRAEQA
jgi:hypothetical protein